MNTSGINSVSRNPVPLIYCSSQIYLSGGSNSSDGDSLVMNAPRRKIGGQVPLAVEVKESQRQQALANPQNNPFKSFGQFFAELFNKVSQPLDFAF